MKRFLASALCTLLLTTGLVVLGAGTAVACSCEENDLASLDSAHAVFSGTIESTADVDDAYEDENAFVATITVDVDLKDNLDDTITVRSYSDDGGNCGSSMRDGQQIAARIWVDPDGRFLVDGCSYVQESLLSLWSPPAGPGGAAEVLVTTNSAPYRFVAFSSTGDRLSFGYGEGRTMLLGLCEDDATLVEIVQDQTTGDQRVELRAIDTFEILDMIPLIADDERFAAQEITCGTEPIALSMWAQPMDRTGAAQGFVYEQGAWVAVDFESQPMTRSRGSFVDWPAERLSAGEIQMQNDYDKVFRFPSELVVPAAEARVAPQLGAGVDPNVAAAGAEASSTVVYWVLGAGALVILSLGAIVVGRGRS